MSNLNLRISMRLDSLILPCTTLCILSSVPLEISPILPRTVRSSTVTERGCVGGWVLGREKGEELPHRHKKSLTLLLFHGPFSQSLFFVCLISGMGVFRGFGSNVHGSRNVLPPSFSFGFISNACPTQRFTSVQTLLGYS